MDWLDRQPWFCCASETLSLLLGITRWGRGRATATSRWDLVIARQVYHKRETGRFGASSQSTVSAAKKQVCTC